ncbi:ribosomal protein L10e/L16 [Phialemonium atrogriseum]|uniref:Ribosomal protein L10e/L16 n=1 Tax=Phialemonium atrogriseum TaxID=1093897 RepID=A0AAJ0C9I4_9PEZI|nr:ribosomal protein L10e/L16 [Phialemonium atrogriseum]KAK1772450.1 ribosomal protein L10e/L16 [Phialemonium atrogriseum]
MKQNASMALLSAFQGLRISSTALSRPALLLGSTTSLPRITTPSARPNARPFSSTSPRPSWLEPRMNRKQKMMKGRPRVPTGGSSKGTTVIWGDYGLRMWDHHRRISAKQLKVAEDTIKQRLRGQRYRLYKRVSCNIGVFVSGNEVRMGKGKGSFDHWASRIAVNQVLFEVRGALHEQVARDAFRLAGNKLPGQYEFVKKGDPAVVGITKLDGVTLEELKRPRRQLPTVEATVSSPAIPSTPDSVAPPS